MMGPSNPLWTECSGFFPEMLIGRDGLIFMIQQCLLLLIWTCTTFLASSALGSSAMIHWAIAPTSLTGSLSFALFATWRTLII